MHPIIPLHHALILTFFILQTSHLSKGTARRAEPLGEIQINYTTTTITSFIIVEEWLAL